LREYEGAAVNQDETIALWRRCEDARAAALADKGEARMRRA
jgi:hypothetical protein